MSTEKIREALGALLAENARANDFAGGPREPGEAERALYRAALAEVEAIEKAARDLEAWQTEPAKTTKDKVRLGNAATKAFELLSAIARGRS